MWSRQGDIANGDAIPADLAVTNSFTDRAVRGAQPWAYPHRRQIVDRQVVGSGPGVDNSPERPRAASRQPSLSAVAAPSGGCRPSEDPGYLMVPERGAGRANGGYFRTAENFASTIA